MTSHNGITTNEFVNTSQVKMSGTRVQAFCIDRLTYERYLICK